MKTDAVIKQIVQKIEVCDNKEFASLKSHPGDRRITQAIGKDGTSLLLERLDLQAYARSASLEEPFHRRIRPIEQEFAHKFKDFHLQIWVSLADLDEHFVGTLAEALRAWIESRADELPIGQGQWVNRWLGLPTRFYALKGHGGGIHVGQIAPPIDQEFLSNQIASHIREILKSDVKPDVAVFLTSDTLLLTKIEVFEAFLSVDPKLRSILRQIWWIRLFAGERLDLCCLSASEPLMRCANGLIYQFFTEEIVIAAHEMQLRENGGGKEGIHDINLLRSALAQPSAGCAGAFFHPSLFDMAAAYLFHLANNHSFNDGNKRTALAVAIEFLELHDVTIDAEQEELVSLTLEAVGHNKDPQAAKSKISAFFRSHIRHSDANKFLNFLHFDSTVAKE